MREVHDAWAHRVPLAERRALALRDCMGVGQLSRTHVAQRLLTVLVMASLALALHALMILSDRRLAAAAY